LNRLCFEIIVERPVTQHLEKRMVIRVFADLFEVVVLAAYAQTLLAVDRPATIRRRQTEEDILELVHPRIGEKQGVITDRHYRRAGDKLVASVPEKVYKIASNLLCSRHLLLS